MALSGHLKQATAVTVLIGPMVDNADGNSVEDSLTISQADVRLSKNGGNMAQKNETTALTHDELGYYSCPLDATDTDTLGILTLMVHESGALPVRHDYAVLPANVWDSLFSTDKLQVDATQIEGGDATDAIAAGAAAALTSYDPPTSAELVTEINSVQADIAALNNLSAAEVNAEVDTALADYDAPTKAELDAGFAALNDPTAGEVADAVWDEALSGHAVSGSAGEALEAAGTAGDPWTTALPGAYGAGTAGKIVGDNLNATISSRASQSSLDTVDGNVDSILADTNELQGDWANGGRLDLILDARASQSSVDDLLTNSELTTALADLPTNAELATALAAADDAVLAAIAALNNLSQAEAQSAAAAALTAYDPPTKAELDAGLAALNDLSAEDVGAEIVGALSTDTYPEPTGAPAATATLASKLGYLYLALRNRIDVTSSAKTFYDDSGNAEFSKALTDDGDTYTEAEAS